jgi:hypothetical protein
VIDQALVDVRAYNERHPNKPLAVRLRGWDGFVVPAWVQTIDGEAIKAMHKNKSRHIGRFWSSDYRVAWANQANKTP